MYVAVLSLLLGSSPDCGGRACGAHELNAAGTAAAAASAAAVEVTPTHLAEDEYIHLPNDIVPSPPAANSCVGKCHHKYVYTWSCQCNDGCHRYTDCCSDYVAVCSNVPPPPPPPPPPPTGPVGGPEQHHLSLTPDPSAMTVMFATAPAWKCEGQGAPRCDCTYGPAGSSAPTTAATIEYT